MPPDDENVRLRRRKRKHDDTTMTCSARRGTKGEAASGAGGFTDAAGVKSRRAGTLRARGLCTTLCATVIRLAGG